MVQFGDRQRAETQREEREKIVYADDKRQSKDKVYVMKITVIMPSCSTERLSMLMDTIDSVRASKINSTDIIYPVVVADGNEEIYKAIKEKYKRRQIGVILNTERHDWIYSMNHILKTIKSDYYIYASDDLIFPLDCIKHAMATMGKHFPDGFGVVDLGRKDRGTFGLFGRKLVDHFPSSKVFCPEYVHYSGDAELCQAVKKMKRYVYLPIREKQVYHFRLNDETRILARRTRTRDHLIRKERELKGYLWGIDFNRVTGGNNV